MAYTYCSYDDVIERINIADNGFDTVTYNSTTIAPFQENAENIINGSLEGFYSVPFTGTVPKIINELCANITAVNILNIVYGLDAYEINKTVAYLQDLCEKTIKKIQNRQIVLPKKYWLDFTQYFVGKSSKYFDFDNKDWNDLE